MRTLAREMFEIRRCFAGRGAETVPVWDGNQIHPSPPRGEGDSPRRASGVRGISESYPAFRATRLFLAMPMRSSGLTSAS
jgi:hypothetical protein